MATPFLSSRNSALCFLLLRKQAVAKTSQIALPGEPPWHTLCALSHSDAIALKLRVARTARYGSLGVPVPAWITVVGVEVLTYFEDRQ